MYTKGFFQDLIPEKYMQKYSPISKIYTPEITNIGFIEVLIDKCKGQLLIIFKDFIYFFFPAFVKLIFTVQGRAWPIWKHLCYAKSPKLVRFRRTFRYQVTEYSLELLHVKRISIFQQVSLAKICVVTFDAYTDVSFYVACF